MLNEDLVSLPNWLVLKLRIEGEEAIRLDHVELVSYEHSYDIRLVQRELRLRDRAGRETTLRSRRFVTSATISATSTRQSSTTSGCTARPPATRSSSATTAPS
ncbi:hypothetical protein [Amycolatopsis pigmentata]|uniref:Glycoside hydrolase family 65 N-terminal domain-containing protein n=1 Tax=Amycolatopsis pigmentata TaxID=450801 RepID=A0ABW5FK42_9PSEU